MGARESLNGRKNKARRKDQTSSKRSPPFWLLIIRKKGLVPRGSSRRSLLFFVPYFSARLDFPSPPLCAPGSPRMLWGREWVKDNKSIASTSHFKLVIKIMYPFNDPGEGEGKQSWTEGSEA